MATPSTLSQQVSDANMSHPTDCQHDLGTTMKKEPRRHPDPCPRHQAPLLFRTTKTGATKIKLFQHHCAHEGCNEKLGWCALRWERGKPAFQHGSGECRDPEIIHAAAVDRHRELWSAVTVISTIIGVTSAILTGYFYQHEMPVQSMIGGITSIMATCGVAIAGIQRSKTPPWEEPGQSNR